MTAAPIIFHAVIAAAGLWLAIRTRRPLTLSVYFGFVLVASLAGLPLLSHTGKNAYRLAYFSVEITHSLILVALAVDLMAHLVSDRLAVFWSVFWISLALVGIFHKRPNTTTAALLDTSIALQFCVLGLLLVLVLAPNVRWTRYARLCASGIALIALGAALPHLHWLQSGEQIIIAFQLSDLVGLGVLVAAARTSQ